MNNAIKSEKVFTLIALFYRKKTEIKGKPLPNRIILLLYICCLVILKTVFLFCDNYIAMTYFTQVDTRLKRLKDNCVCMNFRLTRIHLMNSRKKTKIRTHAVVFFYII